MLQRNKQKAGIQIRFLMPACFWKELWENCTRKLEKLCWVGGGAESTTSELKAKLWCPACHFGSANRGGGQRPTLGSSTEVHRRNQITGSSSIAWTKRAYPSSLLNAPHTTCIEGVTSMVSAHATAQIIFVNENIFRCILVIIWDRLKMTSP